MIRVWFGALMCWGWTCIATAAESPPNELDDAGFALIFDGTTLNGWHVSTKTGHSQASGHKSGGRWVVENGAIIGSQDTPGNGGILITDKNYGDFEVILEMKNDFGPDSGLFLRATEKGEAYQYLIDYHDGGNLAGLYGEGLPDSFNLRNFDFGPDPQTIRLHECPSSLPIKPTDWPAFWKHGTWNQLRARIESNPPKVTTWINGIRFVEYQDTQRRLSDSGGIALQVHGGGDFTNQFVRYRGIRVRELNEKISTVDAHSPIELTLQRREVQSGAIVNDSLRIEPRRLAVVLVDTWNYHWCMTAAARCGSFVGRFNKALPELRKLGIKILWCPTDVADQYVGTPQRENAVTLRRAPLPASRDIAFDPIACFESNKCMCGPGIKCGYNYGWDGLAPGLIPGPEDLMPEGTEELYSCCKQHGITHLIYFGFHTNVCTTGKPVGIRAMTNAGLQCILARDMTDAISGYDPSSNHHPDTNTQEVVAAIERQIPTIHVGDELRKYGCWSDEPVDPVRIAPWGTSQRPYLFEKSTVVSLSAPLGRNIEIRYTLDGCAPTASSSKFVGPFEIKDTTTIRATAFSQSGKPACVESCGLFVKLSPMPPKPDVYLSGITPVRATCSGFHAFGSQKVPKSNSSYLGGQIVARGRSYSEGIGVHAPSQLLYEIKPEYDRFVGRIAVDESVLADDQARAIAMYPSVLAQVFIDGTLIAKSPLLRFQNEPWRFDIELPRNSRMISLMATDGQDGNSRDYANWIEAGFTMLHDD